MASEFLLSSTTNAKRDTRLNRDKICLCHIRQGPDNLASDDSKFTAITWKTFKSAAEARDDHVASSMKDLWDTGPFGGYHKQCYMNYINKDHILRLQRKRKQPDVVDREEYPSTSSSTPTCRSKVPRMDKDLCIICQKVKVINVGGSRNKEKLVQCCTLKAGETLKTAARDINDQKLLIQIHGRDLIADEVKYHHSCYKAYTIKRKKQGDTSEKQTTQKLYNLAFEVLASEVHEKVLRELKVLRLKDLLGRYINILSSKGVDTPEYRSGNLKSRLQSHFGHTITFHRLQNRAQSEIIFSSETKVGTIVERAMQLSTEADTEGEWDFYEENQNISNPQTGPCLYESAKYLRQQIMEVSPVLSWPPSPEELDLESAQKLVPDSLYNMLAWIICSDKLHSTYIPETKTSVPKNINHQVLSIAQDLLHCTRRGILKTPKHIALPLTVKSLTGSSDLVTMLNHFGHGLSYHSIEEVETAIAEAQLSSQQGRSFLPSNIQENVPAIFCWDNNDILEETLSGKGTTHCTNGIVIQRKVHGCAMPPKQTPISSAQHKRKQRTVEQLPQDVISYIPKKRKGPPQMQTHPNELGHPDMGPHRAAKMKDFCWFMCRLPKTDNHIQTVPAWTSFNINMHGNDIPRQSLVGYCQTIDSSPTQLPTVYTVLQRSLDMAQELNQEDCVIVFDQAIYAKGQELIWTNSELFTPVVLRLGSFHMACAFLAAIGKRFGEAGLADVMVESGIIGQGSVSAVLDGRHYNRAVRMHKIMYEALLRLRWVTFHRWLSDQAEDNTCLDSTAIDILLDEIHQSCSSANVHNLLQDSSFTDLFNKVETFVAIPEGPMKEFWNSYIEMVELLLHFIRATREGDWVLHLACVRDMLPWFFAYDHTNYARYGTVYWEEMMSLQQTHPAAYNMLESGDFGVQRNNTHGFSQVPVDQTIEQTLNRNTKTKGGIVGFSLKKGAVRRWLITAHVRAAITDKCRAMANMNDHQTEHKEMTQARMLKDETAVREATNVISSWGNPFEPSSDLVSLGSGVVASQSLKEDLLNAKEKGHSELLSFVRERLQSQTKDFFATLPRLKLKTFTSVKKASRVQGKEVMVQADRNLFGRLLVVAQTREMNMKDVLSHELGPLPWSLSTVSGGLTKTDKSSLAKLLEADEVLLSDVPSVSACIIDAMAMIQSFVQVPDTFHMFAQQLLGRIIHTAGQATRIDFVGDQYPQQSIKLSEHKERATAGQMAIRITHRNQKCPKQWKKFLSLGANKEGLLKFLQDEWASGAYAQMLQGKRLFATCGQSCRVISFQNDILQNQVVPNLLCDHEEADTRLLFHAKHAAEVGHAAILLKSSDTDVEVIALHHARNIPAEITIQSGTQAHTRLVNITALANDLGHDMCQALPGLHALTGCDTVSALTGRGKKKAFDLTKTKPRFSQALQQLGKHVPPKEDIFSDIEAFICTLYGTPGTDVNSLRYQMFCKAKNLQSHHLPPTQDSLRKHILRANYQAAIWKRATVGYTDLPSPVGEGWIMVDGALTIDWMSNSPAPSAILQLASCACKTGCQTPRCSCFGRRLPCTDACSCADSCQNSSQIDDQDTSDSEEE